MKYVVLIGTSIRTLDGAREHLTRQVEDYIAKGWHPLGAASILHHGAFFMIQTMVMN